MVKPYDMNSLEGKAYKITIEEVTKLNLGTLGARDSTHPFNGFEFLLEKEDNKNCLVPHHLGTVNKVNGTSLVNLGKLETLCWGKTSVEYHACLKNASPWKGRKRHVLSKMAVFDMFSP